MRTILQLSQRSRPSDFTYPHPHSTRYKINSPRVYSVLCRRVVTSRLSQHGTSRCIAPEEPLSKKKGRETFIRNPFPPENIDPRENHFQFASHECKYFPNFCLGCGAGVGWLFLWDWEEHLLPRLRGNEMLTAANTCLGCFGEIIAP